MGPVGYVTQPASWLITGPVSYVMCPANMKPRLLHAANTCTVESAPLTVPKNFIFGDPWLNWSKVQSCMGARWCGTDLQFKALDQRASEAKPRTWDHCVT